MIVAFCGAFTASSPLCLFHVSCGILRSASRVWRKGRRFSRVLCVGVVIRGAQSPSSGALVARCAPLELCAVAEVIWVEVIANSMRFA